MYESGQRMSGAIPPHPQYAFMAWCLVKAQGQLYFTFMYEYMTLHLQVSWHKEPIILRRLYTFHVRYFCRFLMSYETIQKIISR
jgi:hypothetical protein